MAPMRTRVLIYAFNAIYFVAFGARAVVNANGEFMAYALIMLVLFGLVFVLDRRVNLGLPILWGLSVWGLAHMAGGNVHVPSSLVAPDATNVLYNLRPASWLPKFDQVVHAYGFGVATFACWRAISAGGSIRLTPGVIVGVGCMGMGLGAANEVAEFVITLVVAETNVGGYVNTGWDLVSNLTGAVMACVVLWIRHRSDQAG
jgi:hypothetical protein